MTADIVNDTANVNLIALAATICTELRNEQKAGAALLHHAMAAGDALSLAQENLHKTNLTWKRWLRQNCFISVRTAFVRQQLARHRKEIEAEAQRVGDCFSIRAALRKITKKSANKPKPQPESPLAKSAWTKATLQERRRFLDSIGVDSFLEALSSTLRTELRRRVGGQRAAMTSELGDTVAKAFRQALSLQQSAKSKDTPANGVASALNAVNNKLRTQGFDLNNIIGVFIDAAATKRQAA